LIAAVRGPIIAEIFLFSIAQESENRKNSPLAQLPLNVVKWNRFTIWPASGFEAAAGNLEEMKVKK